MKVPWRTSKPGSTAILGTRVADYLGGPMLLPNPGVNDAVGTAGPDDVEGPGMQIYNLSLTKFFNIAREGRINLRVRADFVNAFNNVNFQAPATTVTSSGFRTISSGIRRGIFN